MMALVHSRVTIATVRCALCCVALLCAAGSARAEDADRTKPIVWSADEPFEANLGEKSGTLRKNVIITQGTTLIHADRVDMKQNADSSMAATALGNPVSFRSKRDAADDFNEAYAQKIIYDGQTGIIELIGNALLKQGEQGEVRSNYMRYNMRTEKFIGEARPDAEGVTNGPGNRVRGVFMPRDPAVPAAGKDAKDGKDAKGAAKAAPAKAPAAGKDGKPATPANNVPLKSDTELKSTQ